MSTYPAPSPMEEKKPSFWRRPVPMWAFLLLVVILVMLFITSAFLTSLPPTIQQPLVLTPDSRSMSITRSETTTANFTVANLNTTNTITATATATLLFPNSTLVPSNANITLTIAGVQTRNSFAASSDGKTVSFPPGANTLVVRVVATATAIPGNYVIRVSLAD